MTLIRRCKQLLKVSNVPPLSIVIVGVGNAGFSASKLSGITNGYDLMHVIIVIFM